LTTDRELVGSARASTRSIDLFESCTDVNIYLICAFGVLLSMLASVRPSRGLIFAYFMLFTAVLGGLRWNSGTDWNAYFSYFSRNYSLDSFLNGDIQEPVHALYTYGIKNTLGSYSAYLIPLAITISVINISLLYRYANGSGFVLCLYFLNTFGCIFFVRQTVASSFALLFLHQLKKGKKLGSFLSLCVSVGYHYSAAVFGLAYVTVLKSTRLRIAFLLVLSGIVAVAINFPYVQEKIFFYFISGATDDFYDDSFTSFLSARGLWLIIMVLLAFILRKSVQTEDERFIARMYYVLCAISFGSFYVPLVSRFIQYFSFYEVVSFGIVVKSVRNQLLRFMLASVILLLYGYKLYAKINFWPGESDVYFFAPWL
jgi:hypothetical protein